jgi:hypothetical protein
MLMLTALALIRQSGPQEQVATGKSIIILLIMRIMRILTKPRLTGSAAAYTMASP